MARLLHLNGPPGVGKSTVARSYAANNPMALALDADVIVSMIGGWRNDFWDTLPVARGLAAAMAREHLGNGFDVVLPQLVTAEEEIAPFLEAAADARATYTEVVLLADLPETLMRFSERSPAGDAIGQHVGRMVAASGGEALLVKIRGDLLSYLQGRNLSTIIDTNGLTPAESYREVQTVLKAR